MKTTKIRNDKEQLKFCLITNCLGCNLNPGSYRECPHFENKRKSFDAKERANP